MLLISLPEVLQAFDDHLRPLTAAEKDLADIRVKLRYFRRDFALRYLQLLNKQGTAILKAIIAALTIINNLLQSKNRCANYLGLFLSWVYHTLFLDSLVNFAARRLTPHDKAKNRDHN